MLAITLVLERITEDITYPFQDMLCHLSAIFLMTLYFKYVSSMYISDLNHFRILE